MTYGGDNYPHPKWIPTCDGRRQMKANMSFQKKYYVYRDLSGFIGRILLYTRHIRKFGKSCNK
jgi:hypothetical protein